MDDGRLKFLLDFFNLEHFKVGGNMLMLRPRKDTEASLIDLVRVHQGKFDERYYSFKDEDDLLYRFCTCHLVEVFGFLGTRAQHIKNIFYGCTTLEEMLIRKDLLENGQ